MTILKTIKNLVPMFLVVLLCGCPAKEVDLPGDIYGHIHDVVTKESVEDAEVNLFYTNDLIGTYTTGLDGTFLFTNLESSNYSIEVNKDSYARHEENISVFPAQTSRPEIVLSMVPIPEFSSSLLNFGMESTQLSFSISNVGGGILSYQIIPTQDWISVSSESGEITMEPELIEVTIQKEVLEEVSHKAGIVIHSDILGDIQVDSLDIYVNYVMDRDSIFYRTVRIGNQVWMAENLNTGIMVEKFGNISSLENEIIEKLCYGNDFLNCDVFGGLYYWDEMMDYAPADTGGISITQGICPEGWHVPSSQEWIILRDHLGGELVAGGKLKDTSPLWQRPNVGARNETGFSALPAGNYDSFNSGGDPNFLFVGQRTYFWTTYNDNTIIKAYRLVNNNANLVMEPFEFNDLFPGAISVRCVKDH